MEPAILTNPSYDDLQRIFDQDHAQVRFILDNRNKEIHVFPASNSHDTAMIELGLEYGVHILTGIGIIEERMIKVTDLPSLDMGAVFDSKALQTTLETDWNWANEYLSGLAKILNSYELMVHDDAAIMDRKNA
jgi:hypothetical protein